jgi:hypothetical protein
VKNGLYALAIGEIDLVKTEIVEFAENGHTRVLQRRIIVITYRIFRSAPERPARSSWCKSDTMRE